jgi:hypothetical protein
VYKAVRVTSADFSGAVAAVIVAQSVNCIRMQEQRRNARRSGRSLLDKPSAAALRPLVGPADASNRFHEPRRVCALAEK